MKSLKGLVLRYIWKNKLRTIMTTVAVMISAFIIFVIFSIGQNITKNEKVNSYEEDGGWDAHYVVSKETAEKLLRFKAGEETGISDDGCRIKGLYLATYSDGIIYVDDMSYFKGIKLKYGRYPEKTGELISPITTLKSTDYFSIPNPQVGKRVKIKHMVPVGITEEEYAVLEKELFEELTLKYLEELKENDESYYNSIMRGIEASGKPASEYFYLPEEERGPINELYYKYHVDEGREVLLTGIYNSQIEQEGDYYKAQKIVIYLGALAYNTIEDYRFYYQSISDMPVSLLDMSYADSDIYQVTVTFREKKNIEEQAALFGERIGAEPYVNECAIELFEPDRASGSYDDSFLMAFSMLIAGVFGLVVMVIIRNSFNISVNERENDYGMFRCIGLTRKQIVKMVLLEALIVGVIGTALGVLLGILGCNGLLSFLNNYRSDNSVLRELVMTIGHLRFYFIWKAFGMTALFMAVIVGYSMVSPIEKLYKMSPVNCLKTRDSIDKRVLKRLKNKKRKSSTKKGLLGYPEWYGFKNIKIRKGRFYLLVISLAVCFGVVTMTGNLMKTMLDTELNNQLKPVITIDGMWRINYSRYSDNSDDEHSNGLTMKDMEELEKELSGKRGFSELGYMSYTSYSVSTSDKTVTEEELGRNLEDVQLYGLSERYYKEIITEVDSPDYSSMDGVRNVFLVKGDTDGKDYLPELKTGDDITLMGTKLHIAGEIALNAYNELVFRRLTDYMGAYSCYTFIYLKDFDEPIISEEAIKADKSLIIWACDSFFGFIYEDIEEDDGSVSRYLSENGYSFEKDENSYKSMKMLKNIVYFIVGFILLVIMLNLINVRSSDIYERRRELRLMRNIGFSRREIRRAIISEGLLVSMDATMIGTVFGTGFAYLLAKAVYAGNGMLGMYNADYMSVRFGIDWTVFLITSAAVFFINIVAGVIALGLVKKDYR